MKGNTMKKVTHEGTLKTINSIFITIETDDGDLKIPRLERFYRDPTVGDRLTFVCVYNQQGQIVLSVLRRVERKIDLDAAEAARVAAETEWQRPKDVVATIAWWHGCYGEGGYEKEGRHKWYGQNLERFRVNPEGFYGFWLEKGAERLLLDVKSALTEGEEMEVLVTMQAGEFVPGSMRRKPS